MRSSIPYLISICFSFLFLHVFFFPSVQAQTAECDACGYCVNREVPENWEQCAQCLYPSLYTPDLNPRLNQTLALLTDPADPRQPDPLNPLINRPIPPARGKYFTQLGCIDTSLSSFQDPSAAGGVLNFILNKLIFPTVGILAFLSLLYGAFLLMTAQGDPFRIARGKQFLTGAVVGLIGTFGIVFLVGLIGGDILRIPWFSQGTKVTLVGYGTKSTVNYETRYPNLGIYYDGTRIATVASLQGTGSAHETRTVTLPVVLDLTGSADVMKLTFLLENDTCYSNHCCSTNPKPQCGQPGYSGDINYMSYRILFDKNPCTQRSFNGEVYSDGTFLGSYWPGTPITCLSL